MNAKTVVLAMLTLGACAIANAQTGSPPAAPGGQDPSTPARHHRPPPQAIAACDGKKSGDACSFTGRDNANVSGTCVSPPARGDATPPLACRPNRGKAPGS